MFFKNFLEQIIYIITMHGPKGSISFDLIDVCMKREDKRLPEEEDFFH